MRRALAGIRFRIDHRWTPAHASDYLDGELSQRRKRRVEWHAGDCPECRELLRGLKALIASLGGLRDDVGELAAASLLESVRARLDESPRERP